MEKDSTGEDTGGGRGAGLRILFLDPQPFFQCRGSPIRVAATIRALADAGHSVDLLAMPVGEPIDLPPGVRVVRVPNLFGIRSMAIGPSLKKAVYDVLLLAKALAMVVRRRYDVIHSVEEAGAIGVVLARLRGARTVFEIHSDPDSHKGGGLRNAVLRLYRAVERLAIRRSDAIILTGLGMLDEVRRFAPGRPVHAVSDVPSSCVEADAAGVERVRSELAPAADDIVATYIGSFAVYQGIDLLFDAIPAAVRACPRLRFAIVGGTPADIGARRAQMEAAGVAGRVTFLGTVPPETVPNLLCASDLLLSPRLAGTNAPLKLLDFLKAGRAIVATDTPANRIILSDATARFSAADPEAFARATAQAASDPDLRARLGAAGAALAHERYGHEVFRRGLAACYAGLGARPGRSGSVGKPAGLVTLLVDLERIESALVAVLECLG
ncbi:MAG: glycosyltransferase family 4 protein [Lentisphaerae bacterium]|nr:glycosyltransferase family 4 protein [Lentisphaerota bacterium]